MSEFELAVDGARWRFDPSGAIRGFARLAAERPVLDLSFPDAPRDAWSSVEQHPAGITRLRRNGLSAELRPDSVLVLRATRPATVRLEALFSPQYAESAHGRRLVLDGLGGFGAFPTRPGGTGQAPSFEYALRTDDELWICVCPSRPASPVSAVPHIAHEGRFHPFPGGAYPSTQIIQDAARFCSVLALHAYFWGSGPRRLDLRQGRYALRRRPWTTARHVPADPGQFARVQQDVRRAGMKLVLYLSPRYSTAPDLFDEMRRVLDEYGADGLYLDRISDDFRRNDEVVRRTREILGPERILYLHASDEPFGTPRVYCPFTDAHADFVLRGDSGRGGLPLDRFLQLLMLRPLTAN